MAINMTTENSSSNTSPRISFSHDLCQTDEASIVEDQHYRLDSRLLASNSDDFDFCISSNSIEAHETSSAEELFSGGLIRPVQLQERFVHTSKNVSKSKPQPEAHHVPSLPPLPFVPLANGDPKQENLKEKETILTTFEAEQKNQSKSFWSMKRSSSLHCENSHKKISFWSLPLLSRSNSTGYVPNSKQASRESQKQNAYSKQQKNLMGMSASASATSTSTPSFYVYPLSQKPPVRKNYMGSHGNGIRISPVLNVPVPSSHISKGTANLLGLGSLFRNGKDKKIKR